MIVVFIPLVPPDRGPDSKIHFSICQEVVFIPRIIHKHIIDPLFNRSPFYPLEPSEGNRNAGQSAFIRLGKSLNRGGPDFGSRIIGKRKRDLGFCGSLDPFGIPVVRGCLNFFGIDGYGSLSNMILNHQVFPLGVAVSCRAADFYIIKTDVDRSFPGPVFIEPPGPLGRVIGNNQGNILPGPGIYRLGPAVIDNALFERRNDLSRRQQFRRRAGILRRIYTGGARGLAGDPAEEHEYSAGQENSRNRCAGFPEKTPCHYTSLYA
jgi:hypothetical protein